MDALRGANGVFVPQVAPRSGIPTGSIAWSVIKIHQNTQTPPTLLALALASESPGILRVSERLTA